MGLTEPVNVRKLAYALLITAAVGAAVGRILGVDRGLEPGLSRPEPAGVPSSDPRGAWPATRPLPTPTHGDNDRSRWVTVRALVDQGTYVIGRRTFPWSAQGALGLLAARNGPEAAALAALADHARVRRDVGITTESGWFTIDKVLDPQTLEFYSSKPPLLSTVVAGLYWLLKHLFGWTLTGNTYAVVRVILLLINGLPFLIYLKLLARLAERFGASDWGRLYVVTGACFATLVTPFLTTFSNHTVATFAALFALYPAVRIWTAGRSAPAWLFAVCGFFAAFTACCELPAAAFTAALGLALLLRAPRRTLALFAPAAAVPVAAFLLTNYLAIGQLRPAYSEFGGPWYEYEGSHWSHPEGKTGIDFARNRESRAMYAVNVLVGHHGWFSLTPMWLLAAAGMGYGLAAWQKGMTPTHAESTAVMEEKPDATVRPAARVPFFLFPLTVAVSVVVIGFYLVKSDNYGGWTSGLRWLMWLSPLWLLCMLPALDRLAGRRWGRWLGYALLAVSVVSASYPAWNPWRHPWLYRFLDAQGWIPY